MSLVAYPIRCIGPLAWAEMQISQTGSLLGVTSRGLFILTSRQAVIFLSLETHPGPWTANLLGLPPTWRSLPVGKLAQIQAGRIILPVARAYFDCAAAQAWQAPTPDPAAADLAGLPARREAVNLLLAQSDERGFSPLLEAKKGDVPPNLLAVQNNIERLYAALFANDLPAALQAGETLLGLGSGLTPSGDDLLAGLLLGLARWGTLLQIAAPPAFAETLLESARQRTTALSAGLLQAAAAGLADQRLLLAADSLLTASVDPASIAASLLAFGNSSGLDFWLGFSLLTQRLAAPAQ